MKTLTLLEIAKACSGRIINCENPENVTADNITTDSRKAKKGFLFVPLKGERADGHDFIERAFKKGLTASLSERELSVKEPYILVESTYQAIKDIAEYYRGLFSIPFIGVTGSVGKTSTKEMISAVLSEKLYVLKTQGNFNNELGVPLTLFELEQDHEVAVVEMGISGFGEMHRLSKMVRPDICVITNIGDCHLENLKDRAGVMKAKTEMFDFVNENAAVFLNGDDDCLKTITDVYGIKPVFYGLDNKNNYWAENVENRGITGISATLCSEKQSLEAVIPAIGTYMAVNALAAMAIGEYLGLTGEQIKNGIVNYKTVGSRDGLIQTEYITIIDDCYNANPNSVKGGIDTLMNFNGRKVCILGDMKELGEDSLLLHNKVGEYAVEKQVDVLIAVGEEAENIALGVKGLQQKQGESVKTEVYHFSTVEGANKALSGILRKGDTVLVKASRAMKLEQVVDKLRVLTF